MFVKSSAYLNGKIRKFYNYFVKKNLLWIFENMILMWRQTGIFGSKGKKFPIKYSKKLLPAFSHVHYIQYSIY